MALQNETMKLASIRSRKTLRAQALQFLGWDQILKSFALFKGQGDI